MTRSRVRSIQWPPEGLTSEVLRLFVLDPHTREHAAALGISQEDMAACRYINLSSPSSGMLVADDGHRLVGLLQMEPDLWASALFGVHVWRIRNMVLDSLAPPGCIEGLLEHAITSIHAPVDCISAPTPSQAHAMLQGLVRVGFRTVGTQVQTVARIEQRPPVPLRMVPLDTHHFHDQPNWLLDCSDLGGFACDPGFSTHGLRALQRRRLFDSLDDPESWVFVAEDRSGQPLGLIGFRINRQTAQYSEARLALQHICGLQVSCADAGLGEILHQGLMEQLKHHRVEAISVRITMTGHGATRALAQHMRLGYRLTRTDQVLHLWLSKPHPDLKTQDIQGYAGRSRQAPYACRRAL